jgi:hypothetical protein
MVGLRAVGERHSKPGNSARADHARIGDEKVCPIPNRVLGRPTMGMGVVASTVLSGQRNKAIGRSWPSIRMPSIASCNFGRKYLEKSLSPSVVPRRPSKYSEVVPKKATDRPPSSGWRWR